MTKLFRNKFMKLLNILVMFASSAFITSFIYYYEILFKEFNKGFTWEHLIPIGIVVLFVFSLIMYIKSTGRRNRKNLVGKVVFNLFDHLYTEFHIALMLGGLWLFNYCFENEIWLEFDKMLYKTLNIDFIGYRYYNFDLIIISFICIWLIMCPVGSLIKHIKNNSFFTNTLLYNICLWIDSLVNYITRYNNFKRQLSAKVIVLFILALIPVIGWIMLLVLGFKWKNEIAYDMEILKDVSKKIKNGDYDVSITKLHSDEAIDTGMNLIEIKNEIDNIVEEKVRDEKTKVDMILNASFDLKNPLESILENVEILEKDPQLSSTNKKSIEIIRNRAERLKTLSNEINGGLSKEKIKQDPVVLKQIDVFTFLAKGLSEIEREMKKSNLMIKLNIKKSKIVAIADENLLWRSFENLIKDVFKYAERGTNVFISIEEDNGYGIVSIRNEIKNDLKDQLKISDEEFKNTYLCDPNKRTSLVVAKNLIEKQGGKLDIKLRDGSFMASIILKLA